MCFVGSTVGSAVLESVSMSSAPKVAVCGTQKLCYCRFGHVVAPGKTQDEIGHPYAMQSAYAPDVAECFASRLDAQNGMSYCC